MTTPVSYTNLPVPDPTKLTTEGLLREIAHLRELIETRLGHLEEKTEQIRTEEATALVAALATANQAGIARTAALSDLTDTKFQAVNEQINNQADKVALALASSDKAVAKSEVANERRFEVNTGLTARLDEQQKAFIGRAEFTATIGAMSSKLEDLKETSTFRGGKSVGIGVSFTSLATTIAVVGGLLGILIIVLNLMTAKG
jgi:hypothetical protein